MMSLLFGILFGISDQHCSDKSKWNLVWL